MVVILFRTNGITGIFTSQGYKGLWVNSHGITITLVFPNSLIIDLCWIESRGFGRCTDGFEFLRAILLFPRGGFFLTADTIRHRYYRTFKPDGWTHAGGFGFFDINLLYVIFQRRDMEGWHFRVCDNGYIDCIVNHYFVSFYIQRRRGSTRRRRTTATSGHITDGWIHPNNESCRKPSERILSERFYTVELDLIP